MNDPLDAVFIDDKERLARYLAKMPQSLQAIFTENFQRIDRSELAQLRESFASLKARNDELEQRENGYNAEIERLNLAIDSQNKRIAELEARNGELAAYASSIESQLKQYQRKAALRQ